MIIRICLCLALLVAVPAWCQVVPDATGPPADGGDQMRTPPPVNGEAFPVGTGAEMRSNLLRVGLNFQTGYDDNVLGIESTIPVADVSYMIGATLVFDQQTPRLHQTFTYGSGFTLYQHTSARNESDQNASGSFVYRLSPHITATLRDSFQKTTNVFNQPYAGVFGSAQPQTAAVVAPFADQLGNTASGDLRYQFSTNGMIGGSGTVANLKYPNPAQANGLSNSNTSGGSAFYNLRLSSTQYTGMSYQYSRMGASLGNLQSQTQTQTIIGFYTIYFGNSLTLSASGGPQHLDLDESNVTPISSWTPDVNVSIGWQRNHTNLAASYARGILGAGGLLGAFKSNSANANARWQFGRTWTTGLAGSYAIDKNVLPGVLLTNAGGHTVLGTALLQHTIGERFTAELGYTRLHQSYSGILAISENPDGDREYVSFTYHFERPLGR